jgi:hypothetical protein
VMAAMLWTLIALLGVVLAALVADSRAGRRELRTELKGDISELKGEIDGLRGEVKDDINSLRSEVHVLAERQAAMNGRLDLVAAMAHTHPPAVTGRQG